MCTIAIYKPGVMPFKEQLFNMVYNNPHGYGLILKDPVANRIEVIRECPAENDPKKIWDILEKNKDIERFLHVRWKTDGDIKLENTHPFVAYYSDTRQVYFMHNGILHDFKPITRETWVNNKKVVEDIGNGDSDSKRFNDEFLSPLLLSWTGPQGKGDIQDPFLHKILSKYWGSNITNRGLLVSNDQDALILGSSEWKKIEGTGGEYQVSETNYLEKTTRGPEADRLRKKEEEERRKATPPSVSRFQPSESQGQLPRFITNLRDISLKPKEFLTEDIARIWEDFDLYSDEGLAELSMLKDTEFFEWTKSDPLGASAMLSYFAGEFNTLYQKYNKLLLHTQNANDNGKKKNVSKVAA